MSSNMQQQAQYRVSMHKVYSESEAIDDIETSLREMGAVNAGEPLPLSPCLKKKGSKDPKDIVVWNEIFAERKDILVNCDEYGNEDPATWQGRGPTGYRNENNTYEVPVQRPEQVVQPPYAPQYPESMKPYLASYEGGPVPGASPQLNKITTEYGVADKEFAVSHVQQYDASPSLPLDLTKFDTIEDLLEVVENSIVKR